MFDLFPSLQEPQVLAAVGFGLISLSIILRWLLLSASVHSEANLKAPVQAPGHAGD
jgi:hypothetical protein